MRQRRRRRIRWVERLRPFEHPNWCWYHEQRWGQIRTFSQTRLRKFYQAFMGEVLHLDGDDALKLVGYTYLKAWREINGRELTHSEQEQYEALAAMNRELAEASVGQREMALQW